MNLSLFVVRVTGFFLFASMQTILAFPTGAGSCVSGRAAVGGPHTQGKVTSGSIAKGGFTLLLDSKPLTPGVAATVAVGKQHVLTVKARGSAIFRGLLLRLGGGSSGVSTKSALSVISGDSTMQVAMICTSNGVGGVTHTANTRKTSSSAHLTLTKAGKNLPLDVTIVGLDRGGVSTYFYSGYILNAV